MVSRYHCTHLQESSASIHSPGHSSLPPNRGRSGCALMSCRNWLFCSSFFLLSNDKEECIMSMIRVENLTFSYPSSCDTIFEGQLPDRHRLEARPDRAQWLGKNYPAAPAPGPGEIPGEDPGRRTVRLLSLSGPGWRRPTAERRSAPRSPWRCSRGNAFCWTGATVRANPACCGC